MAKRRSAPRATPTPIPAFAPVDSPFGGGGAKVDVDVDVDVDGDMDWVEDAVDGISPSLKRTTNASAENVPAYTKVLLWTSVVSSVGLFVQNAVLDPVAEM